MENKRSALWFPRLHGGVSLVGASAVFVSADVKVNPKTFAWAQSGRGPRAKDQDSAMHGPGCAAKYHIYVYIYIYCCLLRAGWKKDIYIYMYIYIHASLRDPNFPGSRLPYNSRFPNLRSFNFPDSQILSDKLSDPNLTPFPNPMHARIKYFARSHCCKDKCTLTKI